VEMCAFLFRDVITHEKEALIIKDKTRDEILRFGRHSLDILDGVPAWQPAQLEARFTAYMEAQGLTPRELLSFLREAISGQRVTPPLFECMQVLGKERTIRRLKEALALI